MARKRVSASEIGETESVCGPVTGEAGTDGGVGTTTEVAFREVPADQTTLFRVAAGVKAPVAAREAADLEHAVERLLASCIETGVDGSVAFLCEFALETARALRRASDSHGNRTIP